MRAEIRVMIPGRPVRFRRVSGFALTAAWGHRHDPAQRDRYSLRCPGCHPRANPPRLPVDGDEYARRRRARQGKRR